MHEQEDQELGSRGENEGMKNFRTDLGGEYIGMTDGYVPLDLTVQIHRRSEFNGEDFAIVAAKISGQTFAEISAFQIQKGFEKPNSLSATENLDKS